MLIIFFWFNPFAWLIKRAMVLNHEYLADKNRIIMINKKPTPNYAILKSIVILPVAAILVLMFSFKPGSISNNQVNQEPVFSGTSESEILKFLAMNTGYPQEAKNSSDTGSVFVTVKMKKGGIVSESKAFSDRTEIKVPVLHEIVIVGYKSSAAPGDLRSGKTAGKPTATGLVALQNECMRVTNKLSEVKIPEWNDKDLEFAVRFKFVLK